MLAITAAFFLIISMALWVACFRWFKSLINGMIDSNGKMFEKLLDETIKQNDMLNDISEGLRSETKTRIKNTSNVYFDLAVERVCKIISRVKKENHIANHEATEEKVRTLLLNLHDDRNSRFDSFTYRGKKLSSYTNPEWVNWVEDVVLKEVYAETCNEDRARTNVSAIYDRIKIDFYHRLID